MPIPAATHIPAAVVSPWMACFCTMIVPALYCVFQRLRETLKRWFGKDKEATA